MYRAKVLLAALEHLVGIMVLAQGVVLVRLAVMGPQLLGELAAWALLPASQELLFFMLVVVVLLLMVAEHPVLAVMVAVATVQILAQQEAEPPTKAVAVVGLRQLLVRVVRALLLFRFQAQRHQQLGLQL